MYLVTFDKHLVFLYDTTDTPGRLPTVYIPYKKHYLENIESKRYFDKGDREPLTEQFCSVI
jgi:hypothetical protein